MSEQSSAHSLLFIHGTKSYFPFVLFCVTELVSVSILQLNALVNLDAIVLVVDMRKCSNEEFQRR